MHVIEFQKRVLPHAHILIILANDDRSMVADEVDWVVCAELPPDPDDTQDAVKAEQRRFL